MNGFDIKLLSQKTGIKEGKLWMILKRHPELTEMPYSIKSGKLRVFLPAFIDWLKEYEGISNVSNKSVSNVRNDKKLTGTLAREYRLAAEHKLISKEQFQQLIGLIPSPSSPTITPPALMPPEQISKEEEGARKYALNIINKRKRKEEDALSQNKLNFN